MSSTASPLGRAGSPETDDIDGLVTALLTASRVLVGVSARSLAGLEESVTIPQFRALVVLEAHGEIHLNRLARILDVTSSSAMRMVDRLLAMELVSRRENPENRRHTLIALSADGVDVVRRVTSRRRREIRRLVSRMPERDRGALVEALWGFANAAGEPTAGRGEDEVSALGW